MKYMMMGAQLTKAEGAVLSGRTCSATEGCLLALAARAEDRGADPNMGRAKADRLLEIGAHAHAEDCHPGAPGDLAQECKMQRRLLVGGRDAHQAFDRQAQTIATFDDEVIGFGWENTCFLRLLAGVDLDQAG